MRGMEMRDAMDCKEVQNLFIPFIDDTLEVKYLDAFLQHLAGCQDCREEYDIYYTLIMGTRYLETDATKAGEWVDSAEKLNSAQDYLTRYRLRRLGKIVIGAVICLGCMMLFV